MEFRFLSKVFVDLLKGGFAAGAKLLDDGEVPENIVLLCHGRFDSFQLHVDLSPGN